MQKRNVFPLFQLTRLNFFLFGIGFIQSCVAQRPTETSEVKAAGQGKPVRPFHLGKCDDCDKKLNRL